MTEKEKFLHSGPMIPFCCQAGVSVDRESNMASCRWSGDEGHTAAQRSRGRGSTSEESPAFSHQIKSSVKIGGPINQFKIEPCTSSHSVLYSAWPLNVGCFNKNIVLV
ncbi:hypothetical protein PO909_025627 [Leuciscus waleckii]